ncbi:hypothetical protein GI482_00370 [Bacillus sp. N3536]|nr:hypothetical protein GI482_00370 [Bacillus sp. N3536]
MIAIYKETIGDGTLFDMDTIELIMTINNGRINEELERIRNENGKKRN